MKMKKKYGLKNKIEICFDIKLSRLLKNAKGTIVINSTVGMESLKYNTPTICLGKSLYDLEGLTNQGNLKSFFETPGEVNKILFKKFQNYLIKNTQINGSFY
jgi:capsule polysaccharide modification protein KpsS